MRWGILAFWGATRDRWKKGWWVRGGEQGVQWLNPLRSLTSFLCRTQSLRSHFYSIKAFDLIKSFTQKSIITWIALCHRVRLPKVHTLPLRTVVPVTMLRCHMPSTYLVTKPQKLVTLFGHAWSLGIFNLRQSLATLSVLCQDILCSTLMHWGPGEQTQWGKKGWERLPSGLWESLKSTPWK